jgi:hypothetical protein
MRKTRIHINQHNIKKDMASLDPHRYPVITVKDYKENRKGNYVEIRDIEGTVMATVVYSPFNPLPCGAKCWVETYCDVFVGDSQDDMPVHEDPWIVVGEQNI